MQLSRGQRKGLAQAMIDGGCDIVSVALKPILMLVICARKA